MAQSTLVEIHRFSFLDVVKSPAKKIVAKKPVVNKVKATVTPVAKKARKNAKTTSN